MEDLPEYADLLGRGGETIAMGAAKYLYSMANFGEPWSTGVRDACLVLEKLDFSKEHQETDMREMRDELEQSYDDILEAFGSCLDLRDAETMSHSQRVTALAVAIGKRLPVRSNYLAVLARAAYLHDIGKIAIPDAILRKPGTLTDGEKKVMRSHCELGYNMLIRIPFLRDAAEIVLAHLEFYDGTGFPRGLKGDQIPLGARILSIANTLDAMLSDWPYRNALPMSHARGEIQRCAGTQFDPKIVETFLTIPENHWIELRGELGSYFRVVQKLLAVGWSNLSRANCTHTN